MSKPNGILAMNPEKYREIDGVVFDEASYAGIRPMTNARRCPSWAALFPRQLVRKPLSPHPVKLPLYRPFACRAAQAPARM